MRAEAIYRGFKPLEPFDGENMEKIAKKVEKVKKAGWEGVNSKAKPEQSGAVNSGPKADFSGTDEGKDLPISGMLV